MLTLPQKINVNFAQLPVYLSAQIATYDDNQSMFSASKYWDSLVFIYTGKLG